MALLDQYLGAAVHFHAMVRTHLLAVANGGKPSVGLTHHAGNVSELRDARSQAADVLPPDETRKVSQLIDALETVEVLLGAFFDRTNELMGASDSAKIQSLQEQAMIEGDRLLTLYDELPPFPLTKLKTLPRHYSRLYPLERLGGDFTELAERIKNRLD